MAKDDFVWTDELTDKVIKRAMLSKDEATVLKTRARGYSVSQQAELLDCSDSTVARLIASVKRKYDVIQKQYPKEFPARRASKVEEWMDQN